MKEERIYKTILEALKKEYGSYVSEDIDEGVKGTIYVGDTEDSLWGYTITIVMDT